MQSPSALAGHWHEACRRPQVVDGLVAILAEVEGEVSRRGPACWASGRCCHFEKAGHRLYVTGLEAAFTLRRVGSTHTLESRDARRALALPQLRGARESASCPFLADNACSIHAHRPLGCRVYFCDRSAQDWQRELYERMLTRVRELHDAHAIPYVYAEWRELLGVLANPWS